MGLFEWWGDAWDARQCAKAGIPVPGDAPLTPTGRQSEIGRTADHRVAGLRRQAQTVTRGMEADLARLNEQIRQLQERIDAASMEESAILGRPAERLPAEAGVPDAVIAARRGLDNRKQAAPIRGRIDELSAERDRLAAQAARIDHDIVMVWRQARAHARAIGELARRREARWWRLVCRRHPEGARLAAAFDHPRISLAAWVDGPADERSL